MFCWENEVEMILISSAEIDIIGLSFAFSFLFITPTKSRYFHISLPFCDQILNSPIIILWSLKSFYLQGGDHWRVCQRGGRLHCSQRNPHIWAIWNWEGGKNGHIRFDMMPCLQIGVTIVDDNQWEPDEEFFLKLTMLQGHGNGEVKLGRTSIMEITILNDDGEFDWSSRSEYICPISDPGSFQFEKRGHLVKESCGEAVLSVIRFQTLH